MKSQIAPALVRGNQMTFDGRFRFNSHTGCSGILPENLRWLRANLATRKEPCSLDPSQSSRVSRWMRFSLLTLLWKWRSRQQNTASVGTICSTWRSQGQGSEPLWWSSSRSNKSRSSYKPETTNGVPIYTRKMVLELAPKDLSFWAAAWISTRRQNMLAVQDILVSRD